MNRKYLALILLFIMALTPIIYAISYTSTLYHYMGFSIYFQIIIYNSTFCVYVSSNTVMHIPVPPTTPTPPSVSIPSLVIAPPGLNSPSELFSLLLFLVMFVALSKNYNVFLSLAITSAVMMIVWIIVFRNITFSLFFLIVFALATGIYRKYGS